MLELLQNFVELPAPLVSAVTVLIVSAVVFAVNFIVARVPLFSWLKVYAEQWGYLAAAALIAWFQNAVPDVYAAVAVHALELALAIIAVVKALRIFAARRGVQGFV